MYFADRWRWISFLMGAGFYSVGMGFAMWIKWYKDRLDGNSRMIFGVVAVLVLFIYLLGGLAVNVSFLRRHVGSDFDPYEGAYLLGGFAGSIPTIVIIWWYVFRGRPA